MRLILASGSPARRALLDQVGLPFEVIPADVREGFLEGLSPPAQAIRLARMKADAVTRLHPRAVVIGADQVLAFGNEIWSKPPDARAARRQIERLQNRTHALVTAVVVRAPRRRASIDVARTEMTMRSLTRNEIAVYVRTGEWEGCVGGYRVEGRGLALFHRIEGDWTNVLGLPMPRLLTRLRALGFSIVRS